MKGQKVGRFGLAVVSALCMLSLFLPYLYGRGIDRWLQENGQYRSAQSGTLSAEGQENPLAYVLYRSRFLTGTGLETSSDAEQTRKQLLSQTETLAAAGALSQYAAKQAHEILAMPQGQSSSKSENGFASATYWVMDEKNEASRVVQAGWQEKTGLITYYSVSADKEPADPKDCLEDYRSYLGLETLSDWTEISRLEQSVYSWSQAGQLYLFYRWENGSTVLGVSSREWMAEEGAP